MSPRANTSIEIRLFKALKTNSWRAVSLIDLIFPASSRIILERDRPYYRYSGNPIRVSPHIPHCHELKCVIQSPHTFRQQVKPEKNPNPTHFYSSPCQFYPGYLKTTKQSFLMEPIPKSKSVQEDKFVADLSTREKYSYKSWLLQQWHQTRARSRGWIPGWHKQEQKEKPGAVPPFPAGQMDFHCIPSPLCASHVGSGREL